MTHLIHPTYGCFMAALAVDRIPWNRCVRFCAPLQGSLVLASLGLLVFAQLTRWS